MARDRGQLDLGGFIQRGWDDTWRYSEQRWVRIAALLLPVVLAWIGYSTEWQAAVAGLAIVGTFLLAVLIAHVIAAPFRQRDEARRRVAELEQRAQDVIVALRPLMIAGNTGDVQLPIENEGVPIAIVGRLHKIGIGEVPRFVPSPGLGLRLLVTTNLQNGNRVDRGGSAVIHVMNVARDKVAIKLDSGLAYTLERKVLGELGTSPSQGEMLTFIIQLDSFADSGVKETSYLRCQLLCVDGKPEFGFPYRGFDTIEEALNARTLSPDPPVPSASTPDPPPPPRAPESS